MFKLTRPCADCPFRKGYGETFGLRPARLVEIKNAPAFQCHKTVDYDETWRGSPGDRPQQCAGLMAVLHRENKPNQMMQVAERLEHFDPSKLDPDHEAYETWADVEKAHGWMERRRR